MAEGKSDGKLGDEALLKLVNLLYDTSEDKLPMLTRIGRREVIPLSIMMMKESILDPKRIKKRIPLSRVWRNAYFMLQRSVDRWHFMIGAGLAHEQAATEAEKSLEEMEL